MPRFVKQEASPCATGVLEALAQNDDRGGLSPSSSEGLRGCRADMYPMRSSIAVRLVCPSSVAESSTAYIQEVPPTPCKGLGGVVGDSAVRRSARVTALISIYTTSLHYERSQPRTPEIPPEIQFHTKGDPVPQFIASMFFIQTTSDEGRFERSARCPFVAKIVGNPGHSVGVQPLADQRHQPQSLSRACSVSSSTGRFKLRTRPD